jgi:hypothetical protein
VRTSDLLKYSIQMMQKDQKGKMMVEIKDKKEIVNRRKGIN